MTAPQQPETVELPFAIDSSHALDSTPIGTLATKVSPTALSIDHPDKGIQELGIPLDDTVGHLPVGSQLAVISSKNASGDEGKAVAVALPANEHRNALVIIGSHVHDAIAKAWAFIKDETLKVESEFKKVD